MTIKYFLVLSSALICVLALHSCNEDPTGLGFELLYDTVSVQTIESVDYPLISKTENVRTPKMIFNSSCIYIGKTNGMTAVSLLRFQYIPDSLADLSIDKISDCYLELYPNTYAFGDLNANFLSFDIQKVTKYWTANSTCDTLFDAGGNSDYFDNVVQGTYSGAIPLGDTVTSIKIPIRKELLLEWFAMARDSIINWGIAFIPNQSSNIIRQFSAQVIGDSLKRAQITLKYYDEKDSARTLRLNTAIDASIVCSSEIESDDIVIRGGVIDKSALFFDLTHIPAESGILHAELELTLDRSKLKLGNMPVDSIIAGGFYYGNNLDTNPSQIVYAFRKSGTDKYIFPNMVPLIERFIRTGGTGRLVLYTEGWSMIRRLDYMPFFGNKESNIELRPQLRIVYSARKKD